MARAAGPGSRVITCDISPKWPGIGSPAWQHAGVADRIDLRVGDASETLGKLLAELGPGSVDFVFIDADKAGYAAYYEAALELLAPGGLIVVDNTLFFGRVVDPAATDVDTKAIREFNEMVRDDPRVELTMLSTADGITLIRRRSH
jgi:O-methyltransferase